MPTLKKYLFIFLLLEMFFSYATVYAQATTDYTKAGVSDQIKQYLCAPSDVNTQATGYTSGNYLGTNSTPAFGNNNSNDLFNCINQLYKFSIVVASVIGVFFIVIAGYLYIASEGNSESVEKAKNILVSTITSLVILMGGYVLLKALNPDLVQLRSIQPPSVTLQPVGSVTGIGGGGACTAVTNGPASVASLQQTCFGNNASNASMIANKETGGNSTLASGVDICLDQNNNKIPYSGQYSKYPQSGGYLSVSWGLFQINISANTLTTPSGQTLNCPSAFSSMYTGSHKQCSVTNMALYEQCIGAAIDAGTNIQTACRLSSNGQNWKPWANECGF